MIQTEVDTRSQATVALTTCLLVLFMFMAITGNSFVCVALYHNRRLRTVTNLYVLALAIGDIAIAIAVFPFSVIASVLREWPFDYNFAQFHGYITYAWGGVSVYILVLTAINRYFCVVRPQRYPSLLTKKKAVLSIVFVFALTLVIGQLATLTLPVIYIWDPRSLYCAASSTSNLNETIMSFSFLGSYVTLPMSFIAYGYGNVFLAVRKHNNAVIPSLQSNINNATTRAEEVRTSRVLFAAVVGFCICWLPTNIIGIFKTGIHLPLPSYAFTIYPMFAFASSWINPIIYGVMNRAMRREFLKILGCRKEQN
ncbi:melatonin receptor type 1A-like [Oculina patagonica]